MTLRNIIFFKKSLNPKMIPFLESTGGNCQDASIMVEVFAVREKVVKELRIKRV